MSPAPSRSLHGAFLASGLAATAAQVVLLRELVVDVAGDEAAIGAGLAAWLLGIALGARLARKLPPDRAARASATAISGLVLSAPLGLLLGRLLVPLLFPPPGELPGLGVTLLLAGVTLAPAGLLVGRSFTALALVGAALEPAPSAVTRLYVLESAGSLTGGLLVTATAAFLPVPLAGALLASALALLLAAPAARRGGLPAAPFLAATALLLSLALLARPLERWSESRRLAALAPDEPLVAATDTPYQHLVLSGGAPLHLFANGLYSASFPDPWTASTLAHTAACLAPRVERVLSLGGVERGALRFLLEHPVGELTLVEPDARGLAFVRGHLPREDAAALRDPRVNVVFDDPRRFLSRSEARWDLVLLLTPDPVTLHAARLTTRELFRAVSERLTPAGVVVLSLRTAPATLTGDTRALAGSVFGALSAVFPLVRATPGPDTFLVAGFDRRSVTLDPEILAARFRERGVTSPSFAPGVFPALLPPDRVADLEAQLRNAAGAVPPSTDDRPVSFLHALSRRQSVTASAVGRLVGRLGSLPASGLVLLSLAPSIAGLLVSLARGGDGRRSAVHAVAAAGACGMGASLLLLLSYQTRQGALYGRLGLLTALFMLGLALGALAAGRRGSDSRNAVAPRTRLLAATASVLASSGLLALALPLLGRGAPLFEHGALLLLAGCATGAVFPAASALLLSGGEAAGGAGAAASRLWAADHAGAALAALLTPLVLVPSLGQVGTARLLAALAGMALLRLLVRR